MRRSEPSVPFRSEHHMHMHKEGKALGTRFLTLTLTLTLTVLSGEVNSRYPTPIACFHVITRRWHPCV